MSCNSVCYSPIDIEMKTKILDTFFDQQDMILFSISFCKINLKELLEFKNNCTINSDPIDPLKSPNVRFFERFYKQPQITQ